RGRALHVLEGLGLQDEGRARRLVRDLAPRGVGRRARRPRHRHRPRRAQAVSRRLTPPGPVSRFDLVIFDNDGVLVDSEGHANQILSELLNETGVELGMTREECMAEFMGRSMTTIRQLVEARLGRALPSDLEDRYHARLFEVFATKL